MKKILLVLACSAMFCTVKAEGYQVNLQSARQTGMGHTGVAQKLGAESQFFNPAGLAFMQKSIDLSAGFSAVFAKATFTDKAGLESANNVKPSTPMYAYAAFKVSDKFSFGVSVNTPYGSTLDWGKDWAGAHLVQNISLQAFNVQPTAAYKITDKLSIGAGMMISFGSIELSRAMLPVGAFFPVGGESFAEIAPISANLEGSSSVSLGYNVGIMYDATDRLTLGASYRSCVKMKVEEGTADIAYAIGADDILSAGVAAGNEELAGLKYMLTVMDQGSFKAEMPMPANFTIGASYLVNDRLTLAGEVQTVFWSAYEELSIAFTEKAVISAPKNYENSVAVRLGAEYKITERTNLRAGIYFDQTPIQDDNYNPETPGMNKIGTSIGASFHPVKNFSIDFAFLYIAGLGKDGSVADGKGVFAGKYTNHAIAPTLGISYSF